MRDIYIRNICILHCPFWQVLSLKNFYARFVVIAGKHKSYNVLRYGKLQYCTPKTFQNGILVDFCVDFLYSACFPNISLLQLLNQYDILYTQHSEPYQETYVDTIQVQYCTFI